eukprot:745837-Hanusia_phi.AAC.6
MSGACAASKRMALLCCKTAALPWRSDTRRYAHARRASRPQAEAWRSARELQAAMDDAADETRRAETTCRHVGCKVPLRSRQLQGPRLSRMHARSDGL